MSDKYNTVELRVSYGVGRQMGDQIASNPFEGVDAEAVAQGVLDAITGKASQVERPELEEAFRIIGTRMQELQEQKTHAQAQLSETFLAENAQKAGVTVTASGLQYEVITAGNGAKPSASSHVKTHYHGTLIDGTVFDSSVTRGEPIDFPVGGVIAGWTEALQLMPVGSKWRLVIPHQLAYGERGAGADIAPFSTLIFEVELLDIVG
jgi:FKBP-type peptidyl-prolyl cis-trans isomerase FklB